MRLPLFRLLLCKLALALAVSIAPAQAHELRPAVADIEIGPDTARLTLRLALEPVLSGIDMGAVSDTNDSPLAGLHDRLRATPPDLLAEQLRSVWPRLSQRLELRAGETRVPLALNEIRIPEVGETDLPRDSVLVLTADLPPGDTALRFGWDAGLGPVILRQAAGGADAYAAILQGGTLSAALPRTGLARDTAGQVFGRYIVSGFEHIIPKGLDHILFVLGLFFFSRALGPLLWQVTAFTAAHTITLALASLGYVTLPGSLVEPLIAASIAIVALENVLGGQKTRIGAGRIAVVFGFGLLHGLGFASVLGDVGLDPARFVIGLIGFNIGVELGQLAVIAAAAALVMLPFGRRDWYRQAVVIPASLAIAAVGAWWTFERVFLA